MKIYRNVILTIRKSVVIFFCTFFALPCCSFTQQLVISEVMFNPNGNENAREYVELLNLSDEVMSLEGFLIGDGTGFDAIKPAVGESWTVPPGSFGLIVDPDYFTADDPYNIPAGTPLFTVDDKAIGNRGLSNSTAEPVYLISAHGDTVSMVYYSLDCPPGHSWERIIPSGSDSIDNFKPSKEEDGTPGQKNSVT
ncbi:MAG TPA: lamin tail domain-containing protein, partial [bacterium]|nr:lamin tail domain-containing protein [bacterium]